MQLQEGSSNQLCTAYALQYLPAQAPQNGWEATHGRWSDCRDGQDLGGFGDVISCKGLPYISFGVRDRLCHHVNALTPFTALRSLPISSEVMSIPFCHHSLTRLPPSAPSPSLPTLCQSR